MIWVRCSYCHPHYRRVSNNYLMTQSEWLEHLSEKHKVVQVVNEPVTISQDLYRDVQREAELARKELRIARGWDPKPKSLQQQERQQQPMNNNNNSSDDALVIP
jgi:hypothetical protein